MLHQWFTCVHLLDTYLVNLTEDFQLSFTTHQFPSEQHKVVCNHKFENYGITRMDLDDYLFDKQAILDMGGSKRTQLTVGGFITVIPVLILSCFPDKSPIYENGKALTTVIALIIGLLLACFFKALLQMVIAYRVNKHKETQMETFIKAVLFYEPKA